MAIPPRILTRRARRLVVPAKRWKVEMIEGRYYPDVIYNSNMPG
jgi:hypothetical protein